MDCVSNLLGLCCCCPLFLMCINKKKSVVTNTLTVLYIYYMQPKTMLFYSGQLRHACKLNHVVKKLCFTSTAEIGRGVGCP